VVAADRGTVPTTRVSHRQCMPRTPQEGFALGAQQLRGSSAFVWQCEHNVLQAEAGISNAPGVTMQTVVVAPDGTEATKRHVK
jgi:hypothetical protein